MLRATTWWDRGFLVAIIAKGLDGLLEVVAAIALLLASPGQIRGWVIMLVAPELSEDPQDFIANHLLHAVNGLSVHAQVFATVYLLVHGLVKIVLVVALLRDKMWAFPWMLGVLIAFIAYQLYRIVLTPTVGMIALTIFDIIIVVLVFHEYGYHRRRAADGPKPTPRSPAPR